MCQLLKYLILILITITKSKDKEIQLKIGSETKEENISTEEPYYYHIKLNQELNEGYIKIETNSIYDQGPAYIIFSNETHPERKNAFLVSDSISSLNNILYINYNYINNNELYVKIGCHVKICFFNATFSNTKYIEIKRDSTYSYFTGEKNTLNKFKISRKSEEGEKENENATMTFSINTPSNKIDAKFYCFSSSQKNLSDSSVNFQKGIIVTFTEDNKCPYKEEGYYLIEVESQVNDYIIFNSRTSSPNTINYIVPNSPSLDGYLLYTDLKEECFQVSSLTPSPMNYYVINLLVFNDPINLYFKDSTSLQPEQIGIIYYEEAYKISYEYANNRLICLKSENENKSPIYNMQITDLNINTKRTDFYSPQINGYIYSRIIQENSLVYFTHTKFTNYNKQLNMNLKIISGLPEMYYTVCENFPECSYNPSDIPKLVDNGTFIKPHSVNGIFTFSIPPSKDYSYIHSNQSLLVVYCKKGDCLFETSFFDETDKLLLKKNSRFSQFMEINDIDSYTFDINDHRAKKIIFTLYSLSGNAQLILKDAPKQSSQEYLMNINKQDYVFTPGLTTTSLLGSYQFEIQAKSHTYYSVEYSIISKDDLEENILDSGISYLENVYPEEKTKEFKIKHIRLSEDVNFVSTFFGVNCKIKIERNEKEIQSMGNLIQDDISYLDSDFKQSIFSYQITIIEMDNIKSSDSESCMIYISSIEMDVKSENDYDKEIVIPEDVQQQISLNEKTPGIKFLYPHSALNGNVLLNFLLIQNSPLNVAISYESNTEKYIYHIANSQTVLLEEGIIRGGKNNCNQINQVCNIIINIKPENKTDLKNGILFALTAKSKDIIPIYIKKTLMKQDSLSGNDIEYYYTDVIKDEEGEVIVNFNRGNGNIFARIFQKNSTDEKPDWMGRIHLPKPNELDNLPSDPYLKKVYYFNYDTNKCDVGCYLIIGVQNQIHSKTENNKFLYDISLLVNVINNIESTKRQITTIPINEYIVDSLPQNQELNDYYKYYKLYVPSEAKEIIIEFQSDLCEMYVNKGEILPTKKIYDYKFEAKSIESSIFKIPKQEGTFLKGSYFTFAVGTSKSNALFTSLYTFRIRLPNENYKELIPVESDQKAICEIDDDNDYCYFIFPIREYHSLDYIFVHAYSNITSDIIFYVNEIDSKIIDLYDIEGIKKNLPNKNNYNQSSENEFTKNFFKIKLNHNYNSSYVIVGVYSSKKSTITLQSIFYSYINIIEPNPSSEQLFYLNQNETITLSFPLLNSFLVNLFSINGNGIVTMKAKENERKYNLKGISDTLGIIVPNEKKENFQIEISNNEFFAFYISYEQRSEQNFDETFYGTNGQMFYSDNDFPFIYFTNVPNEDNVSFIISIKNYTINQARNDDIINDNFTLTGVVVSEKAILDKKRDKTLNPDMTYAFQGKYDSSLNVGRLFFDKDDFDNCKYNGKKYLYVILNKAKGNKNQYKSVETEFSIVPNNKDYIAPYNQYYFGKIHEEKFLAYKLRKNKQNHTFFKVEFSTNSPTIDFAINDEYIDENPKNKSELIESINYEYGKYNIYIKILEKVEEIYLYVIPTKTSKLGGFSFKYSSNMKKEDFPQYIIKDTKINEGSSNNQFKLTFKPIIKKVNDKEENVRAKYYVRVIEMQDVKDNEIISSISLLQVTPISVNVISSNDTNEVSIILNDFPNTINTFISVIGITNDNESHEYFSYSIVENNREATKNILFIIIIIILGIVVCVLLFVFYFYHQKMKKENDDLKHKIDNEAFETHLIDDKNKDV